MNNKVPLTDHQREEERFLKAKEDLAEQLNLISTTITEDRKGNKVVSTKSRIQVIYDQMCCLIASFIKNRGLPFCDQKEYDELIGKLTNLAVCEYLDIWLENDTSSRQNISAFLTYNRYLSHEEKKKINSKSVILSEETRPARNASYKLRAIVALQNQQAKKKGRKYRRMPYKSHNYKFNYDYITLRFIGLYSQAKSIWEFIDILFYDKHTSVEEKRLPLHQLADAYVAYDSLLCDISRITDDRKFVIACLQLRKFEMAYRCYFFGKIAQYMIEHKIPPVYCMPPSLKAFYQNYRPNETDLCRQEARSLFWILDGDYLEKSYRYLENTEMQAKIQHFAVNANGIVKDAVALYNAMFPGNKQCPWTGADFENARNFLVNQYKIHRALKPLTLGKYTESSKPCFKYIEYLYTSSEHMSQTEWECARNRLQRRSR